MEPSAELQAVVGRFFAAVNARDAATFINFHADDPGVLFIGTDPEEWWPSLQSLRPVMAAQMREFEAGGVTFDAGEVDAHSEGTVGWIAARPRLLFPDGSTGRLRFTGVLHLDLGVWRFIQWHLSAGVENEETIGFEMTTTVEQLAVAVQEERPDLSASAAADGTITIAFSDIEQSTEIAVRLGDHKWLDLVRWHDDLVADLTTREGGHIVKSLGDGHMLAFPSASRALRGAMKIQRSLQQPHDGESVRVRIGVHTGEVLREADDFFGYAVIMAARVAAEAHGNEILVSSLVRELTRSVGTFEFAEPRTAELKGIPGQHQLFPLVWDDAI
jgi:class 3 adenylate cyclase/ketosteroid isomerase-like protein